MDIKKGYSFIIAVLLLLISGFTSLFVGEKEEAKKTAAAPAEKEEVKK